MRLPAGAGRHRDRRARRTCVAGRCSAPWPGWSAAALVAISPWHILPEPDGGRVGAAAAVHDDSASGCWRADGSTGRRCCWRGWCSGSGCTATPSRRLLVPLLVLGFAALWWRELALALALGAGRRGRAGRPGGADRLVRADAGRAGATPDGGAARPVSRAGADPVRRWRTSRRTSARAFLIWGSRADLPSPPGRVRADPAGDGAADRCRRWWRSRGGRRARRCSASGGSWRRRPARRCIARARRRRCCSARSRPGTCSSGSARRAVAHGRGAGGGRRRSRRRRCWSWWAR